jgi:hypothetical protein
LRRAGLALAAAARASAPRGLRIARATGRVTGRVAQRLSVLARTRRGGLVALGARALWWMSLWIWVSAGASLLGWDVDGVDDGLWRPFAIGLGICAAIVLVARERHLRWLAVVLGTGHAALGLLAWAVLRG